MRRIVPALLLLVCTAALAFAEPTAPRRALPLPAAERAAMAAAIAEANADAQSAGRLAHIVALLTQAGYQVAPNAAPREFQLLSPEVSSRPIVFTITLYPTDTTATRFTDYHFMSSMSDDFNPRLMFSFRVPFGLPVISQAPERLHPGIVLKHLSATLAELPDYTTRAPGPLRLDTERQRALAARTHDLLTMRETLESWRLEIENLDDTARTESLQNRGRTLEESVGKLDEVVTSLQEERLALAAQPTP